MSKMDCVGRSQRDFFDDDDDDYSSSDESIEEDNEEEEEEDEEEAEEEEMVEEETLQDGTVQAETVGEGGAILEGATVVQGDAVQETKTVLEPAAKGSPRSEENLESDEEGSEEGAGSEEESGSEEEAGSEEDAESEMLEVENAESAVKTQEEIDAEIEEMKTILINEYITRKATLKHERKRNAYFQDRIYRTSVRKGIIIESELEESSGKKTKKRRRCQPEEESGSTGNPFGGSLSTVNDGENDDDGHGKHRIHKTKADEEAQSAKRGFIGEKFANEAKYQKLLRKIMKLQRTKASYFVQHQATLEAHALKCKEWSELHVSCMNALLEEIGVHSELAVDSNTGKRMPKHETEEYCAEVGRIHRKYCDTMLKMYKSRRGLEFTLKRLKESEIQEGEEIEILEFELLKDENSTLKDKLGDRLKDVENIKSKISYAIQNLDHIRNKMSNMTESIGSHEEELLRINEEVYAAKAKTEEVTKELVQKRREERALVVDSGLLDNSTLLRDYEETTQRVNDLKEVRKSLERKMVDGNRELLDMQDRTAELKNHYPTLFSNSGGEAGTAQERQAGCHGSPLTYTCKPKL